MEKLSRRDFIKGSLGAAALMAVPSSVLGKSHGHVAPSDKLNIAGIGIGGVGRRNLKNMSTENIVALCDVDWTYADKTFKDYPNAILYKDWRKMFDEIGNSIDAVLVATPDHNHAVITATAMTLGKHAYTQKPLTHSVYEARLLAKLAKKYKVATQMGNQGNSFDWCRRVAEWIWSGVIGDVYEVHCWTDRPIWPQGLMKPSEIVPCPDTLDWDLFIGPAEKRPYHPSYTPWNWRGWYDFGTGALGDMACHIMDPVCWALNLKYPSSVIASSTLSNLYSPPHAEVITYTFPARPQKGNVNMPEVKIYWYDGGLMPPRPEELADGTMMGDENGGLIFVGTKGKIMTGCYGMNPTLLPLSKMESFKEPAPTLPRVPGGHGNIWDTNAHEQDWIRACKESPQNRREASSNFQFSGPFTEMVDMGVLAVRLAGMYGLHQVLQWDGENMRFTNISPNEKIKIVNYDDFKVIDGDPRFDRRFADFNALEMADEWIKHTYHNGYSLPDMPTD
jgi:predicted dehydrogenase